MDFLHSLFKYDNNIVINGLTKELNVFYVLELLKESDDNILIVTSTLYEANNLFNRFKTYTNDVYLFPMDDFITSVAIAISPELKLNRLETLENINGKKKIVITNLMGLLRFLPDKTNYQKLLLDLKCGISINRDNLVSILDKYGYNKTSLVTQTGEYAVRGFIIDIFIIDTDHPIRIEFFDNEIESIRYFDEESQLSKDEVSKITLKPINEVETTHTSSIFDYLDNPKVVYINKDQIDASYHNLLNEITEYNEEKNIKTKHMYELSNLNIKNWVCLNSFNNTLDDNFNNIKEMDNFNSNFDVLKNYVNKCIDNKKTVIFCLKNKNQEKIIAELFNNNVNKSKVINNEINILIKEINQGFVYNDYVVISDNDIEKKASEPIKYKNTLKIGKKIKGFDGLQVGDYVVHLTHGIGIYRGVITLSKNGLKKDYIQIDYLGNDKVYIPVEKINTIYKYSGNDGVVPRINKLNSTSWAKTKISVRNKIKDISKELINLYAARKQIKGKPYETFDMEANFASEFMYDETKDQAQAIIDIDKDLQKENPMDRLLCGDVGYGKTEVAFRAMFKTVCNNSQVMYLCPTTILSNQQYKSAIERFKDFPINIALLNRFTTKKEQTRIIDGLAKGSIDIVIGTHRLLSDDIKLKDLGLLIIDEEQRFGVTHKEKIKQLKNDINVLTLSATPIPRTLKMAMSGLRDLSIIDTPPVNRYPIQTYVIAQSDLLIKDAIYKEMARKGQVFVLYNNIEKLDKIKQELHNLVPEARICVAHGALKKDEIEEIMQDFIDYKYDILLCTTIIETGIDIPNVNSLIIYNADCFGLSQLYQIRGRVGRSNKIAYAYLMYDKNKELNDIAVKRLQAIKEFTELGSGYRIALRDLSIRGAGNILGGEQAGYVDSVGMELYMKLIDEEMLRLKGVEVKEEETREPLINVETHINDSYVSDEEIKIEIHQIINTIDSLQSLLDVKAELEDRFGKISNELEVYMYEEWFEKIAEKLGITRVNQTDRFLEIELPENISNHIKGDKLMLKCFQINEKINLKYFNKRIKIILPINNLEKHFIYYAVDILNIVLQDIN
ncbi:MAG: transcription-repair coupling factor [Bacilli bacterium]|nr:transcription-repair coupling factor [Bacilli bacterium]